MQLAGSIFRQALLLIFLCALALPVQTQSSPAPKPIQIKVVVVAMFQRGEDTGDAPGEFQIWIDREHFDQILPLPAGYHHLRLNRDGVLEMLTGVGTAKAAASVMAVGLDPRFDLTKAYWVIAGVGGGDPQDVSLGSAVWADHVVDGDLAFEIDAREIPPDWPTGYVPLRKSTPYEQPVIPAETYGELYTLNGELANWAFHLTKDVPLEDSDEMRTARARFKNFPNAQKPPFVTVGTDVSASTFFYGARMNEWANAWTKYYTGGQGNFMVSAMEDTGTLQALTFLDQAKRVDLQRVMLLRTISNYDMQAPGAQAADGLKDFGAGRYSAYMPSLEAAQKVGDTVVRDIVAHWRDRESTIPSWKP